jgi:hypothetical protein
MNRLIASGKYREGFRGVMKAAYHNDMVNGDARYSPGYQGSGIYVAISATKPVPGGGPDDYYKEPFLDNGLAGTAGYVTGASLDVETRSMVGVVGRLGLPSDLNVIPWQGGDHGFDAKSVMAKEQAGFAGSSLEKKLLFGDETRWAAIRGYDGITTEWKPGVESSSATQYSLVNRSAMVVEGRCRLASCTRT